MPSGNGLLGGVTRSTNEAILLCEGIPSCGNILLHVMALRCMLCQLMDCCLNKKDSFVRLHV